MVWDFTLRAWILFRDQGVFKLHLFELQGSEDLRLMQRG